MSRTVVLDLDGTLLLAQVPATLPRMGDDVVTICRAAFTAIGAPPDRTVEPR